MSSRICNEEGNKYLWKERRKNSAHDTHDVTFKNGVVSVHNGEGGFINR